MRISEKWAHVEGEYGYVDGGRWFEMRARKGATLTHLGKMDEHGDKHQRQATVVMGYL